MGFKVVAALLAVAVLAVQYGCQAADVRGIPRSMQHLYEGDTVCLHCIADFAVCRQQWTLGSLSVCV